MFVQKIKKLTAQNQPYAYKTTPLFSTIAHNISVDALK
jgi:hypothetical protein